MSMHDSMKRLYRAAKDLRNVEGQTNVANLLGQTPQTVKNWESRGVSKHGAIAAEGCIGTRVNWVLHGTEPMLVESGASAGSAENSVDNNFRPLPSSSPVPVISWIRAGQWCEAHDPWQPGDADDWLPCPVRHGKNTFALRVDGDSMDGPGGYREGEVIFVDPDVRATPGRDVVARTPNGTATFKRLKEDAQGQYLLALNPAWPDRIIRVPTGTVICGVVIGSFTPR